MEIQSSVCLFIYFFPFSLQGKGEGVYGATFWEFSEICALLPKKASLCTTKRVKVNNKDGKKLWDFNIHDQFHPCIFMLTQRPNKV